MATKVDIAGTDPFAFKRNQHGHIVVTVTGLDFSGKEEIERLEAARFRIGGFAEACLTSTAKDGYDVAHRLVAGREYRLALVPGKEIARDADRTTANLQALGEKYGYGRPLAGIVPRLREALSDAQMEAMGFWYIAALHEPIADAGGGQGVLGAGRSDDGRSVSAYWGSPDRQWRDNGAFAFVLPAS